MGSIVCMQAKLNNLNFLWVSSRFFGVLAKYRHLQVYFRHANDRAFLNLFKALCQLFYFMVKPEDRGTPTRRGREDTHLTGFAKLK